MRVSVMENDPGYRPYAHQAKAFLDGVEVTRCFTADEELGKIWRHKTSRKGKIILNPQRNGTLKECLNGVVEIQFPEKWKNK